jgi:hypothetical protein
MHGMRKETLFFVILMLRINLPVGLVSFEILYKLGMNANQFYVQFFFCFVSLVLSSIKSYRILENN